MAELSRGELLAWVNDLTNLNLPKVESMGTGAAHCLIIHSIFGDVPTHKINFKTVHEYEYVHNFKVLQEAFTRHRIDRTIPVDKLIKLKFQDNLEFLQWMKKFWDANYEGESVSAASIAPATVIAAQKSSIVPSAGKTTPSNNLSRTPSGTKRPSSSTLPNVQIPNIQVPPPVPHNVNPQISVTAATNALQLAALTKTITELKLSVDEMEKERDFYFNKLRDIEILTQKISDPVITSSIFFKQITEILYTTEEGFEIPQENSGGGGGGSAVNREENGVDQNSLSLKH